MHQSGTLVTLSTALWLSHVDESVETCSKTEYIRHLIVLDFRYILEFIRFSRIRKMRLNDFVACSVRIKKRGNTLSTIIILITFVCLFVPG